ncbi:adenine-specific DNA-methyltransferase [Streptomyces sp. BK208]|uniref:site-specific DNA-methyltransferase n=1 Tax=Streptomyces sp. BK208 TaxID=2512150 RepID=UPI00105B4F3D|nr:site-specific DNA-methyltransferase [Streptomyces sp. BK208]TDT31445.1 adenine-specific DNA-methyltransferase [Streptomyces sp. BK208]
MAAPRKRSAKTAANSTKAVQAIKHEETRVNNPTADAFDLVTEAVEAAMTWRGKRDFAKDPQLVWKGKDEQDREDLEAPAPPIFRQERIEPRYLVKQLLDETKRRRESEGGESAGEELSLFGAEFFDDGIPDELDKVDWYNHQMNWTNRMILGDSLQVMASLAERENLRGKVQMVYIDPPYGIKFGSNWQARADNSRVRDGKIEDTTREVEQIKAFRDTWELGVSSYLSYLRDRLSSARDLLTESGSIFIQIGDENVHLVRSLLDEIFGAENFVSQIAFTTTSGAGSFAGGTNVLASIADYVLWFAKDINSVRYRQLYSTKVAGQAGASKYSTVEQPDGTRRPIKKEERESGHVPGRLMVDDNLTSQTTRVGQTTVFPVEFGGRVFTPGTGGWKTNRSGMERLVNAGRVMPAGRTLRYVRYFDDFAATPITNVWNDIGGVQSRSDPKIYVVQTSTTAIQRCMLMSTDPGDLVLDPTCGSGTTAYVAEQWGRRWITVDTSRVAIALARHRLMGAKFPAYLLADSPEGKAKEAELSQQPLDRSPSKHDIRRGFVYERVPHITLKSIANNPDIKEGMTRDQIDKAIKKHAQFETLYDRPYENKKAVRVAGPFTVESLSPHRSVSFDQDVPASEKAAEMMPSGASYEETILEHVKKAGVQNGYRNERLEFESVEPVSGRILTAVGARKDAEEGTPARVGIALGPEYGTVDSLFIKNAAREALRFGEIDLLLILGFAFDANATEATNEINQERGEFSVIQERHVGKMTVLNVRMNPDLAMGDELANTGAGNLFTVFGEPDIELTETSDGQLVAEIKGLDIYNPTTGDVRAEGPDDIMMWSIDTDYDAEAFIVRHVYFSGENGKSTGLNPYERLGKALKGQIDEEALSTLFTTKSRPFPKPESGRIAVKVVNYYGDEVLKAIDI